MKFAQLVQVQGNLMLKKLFEEMVKESEAVDGELATSVTSAKPMFPPTPPSGKKLKTKELSMKAYAAHITIEVKELLLLDPP